MTSYPPFINITSPQPYKLSFTTGGLYYPEALKVAALYQQLGNWPAVSQAIASQNLLQARTQSTLKRSTRELLPRLQVLTPAQLAILAHGGRDDQQHILWLAACKHYRLVREFAFEVLREKFLRLDLSLANSDFDTFYFAKAEWNPELLKVTRTSRIRGRQVLMKMLSEAQIISAQKEILPQTLSAQVARSVVEDDPALLLCFPISDFNIKRLQNL
jgi:hypothetical protein